MDFKFVFSIISIDIKGQTKLEDKWAQIDHFCLKKHNNGHISKCHFAQVSITEKLLLLHFSMNSSETFRIDENIDFANTVHGAFLI